MQLLFMNFDLDHFLPYRVSQLTNRMSRDMAARYEDRFNITRTQWRILAVLLSGAQTAQFIADKTVMDKSVISRAVKALIERGFIRRQVSQNDGRLAPLRLTKKGKAIADEISIIVKTVEAHWLARLNDEEKAEFSRLIDKITQTE